MAAGIFPFTIKRGATYSLGYAVYYQDGLPKDISDYVPVLQIRSKSKSAIRGALILSATVPGHVTILSTHAFMLEIGATETEEMSPGVYDYDLFLVHDTDDDDVIDLLTGEVTVQQSQIE